MSVWRMVRERNSEPTVLIMHNVIFHSGRTNLMFVNTNCDNRKHIHECKSTWADSGASGGPASGRFSMEAPPPCSWTQSWQEFMRYLNQESHWSQLLQIKPTWISLPKCLFDSGLSLIAALLMHTSITNGNGHPQPELSQIVYYVKFHTSEFLEDLSRHSLWLSQCLSVLFIFLNRRLWKTSIQWNRDWQLASAHEWMSMKSLPRQHGLNGGLNDTQAWHGNT